MRNDFLDRGVSVETYLLTWNPEYWAWGTLDSDVIQTTETGRLARRWSCGVTVSIESGSRVYLMKLGVNPKGLIAAGRTTSGVYLDKHWDCRKIGVHRMARYVDVEWCVLAKDPILELEELNVLFPRVRWTPRCSGTRIAPEVASALDKEWTRRVLGDAAVHHRVDKDGRRS